MNNEQMTPQELLKLTEEKLGTWDVLALDHEAKVAWAKTQIPSRIVEIINAQDRPLQVVVHEQLFDAVTEALQNVEVPESATIAEGDSPEDFANQFKAYCQKFPVRSAKTEEMIVPPSVSVPPEQQFVVFLTLQGQQINYLQAFDQRLGISQCLADNKIPIGLTQEDMLEMVKWFVLLQCINKQAQNQVVAAKSQDLSGQIFRP